MTFPVSAMDHPSSLNYPINLTTTANDPLFPRKRDPRKNFDYTLHTEGINIGYRYFNTVNKQVSFPFGYGLSYTNFVYGKATVKATGNGFTASVVVTNTGNTPGKEVVQVYVTAPQGNLEKPASELKSFAKTRLLQPGESQTLTFDVSNYDLASFDESIQSWVSTSGNYIVKFAASVEDVRTTGNYKLSKEFTRKVNDVLRPDMDL